MNLSCDIAVATNYKSASQMSRLISEDWIGRHAYCLDCSSASIAQTRANTPSADFICSQCGHTYELKSFHKRPVHSLINGAYGKLISQIERNAAPTLLLLERDEWWRVRALSAVHSVFLTREVVEPRRPLSKTARRAGWVGCNIRLDRIPKEAEVFVVRASVALASAKVRQAFQRFSPMQALSPGERGWTALTLSSLREMPNSFTLQDFYRLEHRFVAAYPANRNVRAKMGQQLQRPRDLGALAFEGRGRYRILG